MPHSVLQDRSQGREGEIDRARGQIWVGADQSRLEALCDGQVDGTQAIPHETDVGVQQIALHRVRVEGVGVRAPAGGLHLQPLLGEVAELPCASVGAEAALLDLPQAFGEQSLGFALGSSILAMAFALSVVVVRHPAAIAFGYFGHLIFLLPSRQMDVDQAALTCQSPSRIYEAL